MKVFRNISVLIVMVSFFITGFATADEVCLKNEKEYHLASVFNGISHFILNRCLSR